MSISNADVSRQADALIQQFSAAYLADYTNYQTLQRSKNQLNDLNIFYLQKTDELRGQRRQAMSDAQTNDRKTYYEDNAKMAQHQWSGWLYWLYYALLAIYVVSFASRRLGFWLWVGLMAAFPIVSPWIRRHFGHWMAPIWGVLPRKIY